jgi:hypothetical protein
MCWASALVPRSAGVAGRARPLGGAAQPAVHAADGALMVYPLCGDHPRESSVPAFSHAQHTCTCHMPHAHAHAHVMHMTCTCTCACACDICICMQHAHVCACACAWVPHGRPLVGRTVTCEYQDAEMPMHMHLYGLPSGHQQLLLVFQHAHGTCTRKCHVRVHVHVHICSMCVCACHVRCA